MKQALLAGIVLTVACGLTSTASAELRLDLELAGGGTVMAVTAPDQVVGGIELYARITPSAAGDALLKFYTAFYSSAGGLLYGNLSDVWAPGTPFSLGTGATLGTLADLDLDGDVDIGATNALSATGWMHAKAVDVTNGVPGSSFHVATLIFSGTAWTSANPHGVTTIYTVPRGFGNAHLWKEGGANTSAVPTSGSFITLYRPAAADGGLDVVVDRGVPGLLDASASIGTIAQYEWDLNGDGTPDAFGQQVLLTYEGLATMGMTPGNYTVTLKTKSPYTESTDTVGLTILPEPGTLVLLGLGGVAHLLMRRRRAA